MHKRISGTLAVLAVLAAGSVVAQAPGGFDPNTRIYIVRPGDTLWGIAGDKLADHFKWPRIWENNPAVDNPHMIFPDAQLTIPVVDGEAPAPVAAPMPEPVEPPASATEPLVAALASESFVAAAAPVRTPAPAADEAVGSEVIRSYDEPFTESRLTIEEKPRVTPARGLYVRLGQEGLIETRTERSPLAILAGQDERDNYSAGDVVYLSKGSNGDIQPGQTFEAYEVIREVKHPETGEKLGTWIRVIGLLEVTQVDRKTSAARVIYSSDAILREHRLRPASERRTAIAANYGEGDELHGQIVLIEGNHTMAGAWQVVYVDLGERNGIELGRLLSIDRRQGSRKDPLGDEEFELPSRRIGQGVVVEIAERTATVLVVESLEDIRVGDSVTTIALAN